MVNIPLEQRLQCLTIDIPPNYIGVNNIFAGRFLMFFLTLASETIVRPNAPLCQPFQEAVRLGVDRGYTLTSLLNFFLD